MPRKQTRRSISVSAEVYQRIDDYCKANQISKSSFVEKRTAEFLDENERVLKSSPKAPPFCLGDRVNYHAVVGGPITLRSTVILGGPYQRGDHVSWRIEGKPGTIDEAALSKVV